MPILPISASRPIGCRAITDVVTDPDDPPRFETIARLRPRDANPIAYPGRAVAEKQRAAYPDVEPLVVTSTPQQAYETALAVITKRKWFVVDARAPQPGRREGRIEAVARTPIMGFREDVVVRVRARRRRRAARRAFFLALRTA